MRIRHAARTNAAALAFVLGTGVAHAVPATEPATLLIFSQQDEGGAPYEARMLVTPQYLRMDNGADKSGFILLNRQTHTVYSVSRSDRTIMVVKPQKILFPRPARFRQRIVRDRGHFPTVAGKQVDHYTLLTNGRRCFDVYAAAGLLPDAVSALREYQRVLAGEQAVTETRTPRSMQSVCDLSNYIFRPARYLDFGFPVRQRDESGATRQLLNFRIAVPVASSLFALPSGFRRYRIGQMAGSAAP
ncbi:MAG: hypothetical protein ACYDHM_04985 [Acidiferrobacterales bacterium]